jgi:hypothetical protein
MGAAQLSGTAGVALSNVTVATFNIIDPTGSPGSMWNAMINWGDGSTPDKRVMPTGLSTSMFAFVGSHTYSQAGSFTITVMIAVPGSHNPNSNTVTSAAVISAPLQSITVTPSHPTLAAGQTQQFTATGTFSNNTTQNLTSQVTWASATTMVASITTGGLASARVVGTTTISATFNGISGSTVLTVTPGAATHFKITLPSSATQGVPLGFTVTAQDSFGNTATSYNGTVHLSSSDAGATLPADVTLTGGLGTFTATLKAAGSDSITATDVGNSGITGTSNTSVAPDLSVTALTPTVNGFTATFSKPIDPSALNLYDSAFAALGPSDVTLVGPAPANHEVRGSLVIAAGNASITFLATAGVLAAGSYSVTFRSASNGFKDTSGVLLDGANSGVPGGSYAATFSVAAAPAVLGLPEFARGPDGANNIKVPNNSTNNIPLTLNGISGLTDLTFDLTYNPALLNISSVANGSSGGTLTLTPISSGLAGITFHSATPLSGNLTIGQIIAQVPSSAAGSYRSKSLLHLSNIVANGGALSAIGKDGLEVVAYIGDTNGDGVYSPVDASFISRVATTFDTGLAAYPLLDPQVVGDFINSLAPTSTDVTLLNRVIAGISEPQIPLVPGGLTITPTGPDPVLSVPPVVVTEPGSTVVVPIDIDTVHPAGAGSGLTEAILAVRFDPQVFSLAPADVQLGTLPASGGGWQLVKAVNVQTGQIGIDLFGGPPMETTGGGSLVTITFHVRDTAPLGSPGLVSLTPEVNPTGQRAFHTIVSDAQGAYVIHYSINEPLNPTTEAAAVRTSLLDSALPRTAHAPASSATIDDVLVSRIREPWPDAVSVIASIASGNVPIALAETYPTGWLEDDCVQALASANAPWLAEPASRDISLAADDAKIIDSPLADEP